MIHLSEAVARRSVGKYTDLDNFPSEPDITKIKAFLDAHGFVDYTKNGALTSAGLMTRCKNNRNRGYKLGPCENGENGTWWIIFGDAYKTYMCRDINHYDQFLMRDDQFRITYGSGMHDSWTPKTYDEFRKKAVEYLKLGEVNEAVAKRTAGKYEPLDIDKLPSRPNLMDADLYFRFLEDNGFIWLPKKIDISGKVNLCKVFDQYRRYSSEGVTHDRDGKEFPLRLAFGNGDRVYRLYVVEQHIPTNYVRYDMDIQQKDGIVIEYNDYKAWIESAIKFFGMK